MAARHCDDGATLTAMVDPARPTPPCSDPGNTCRANVDRDTSKPVEGEVVHKKSVEVVTNRARPRWVRAGLAVGTGVAALVAVPLGASALTSSTTAGQIEACYPTGTGLKVMNHIATGTACPTGYSSLTWNKVGPQGLQGVQGPAGISVGASGTSATSVPLTTAQTLTPVLRRPPHLKAAPITSTPV